MTGVCYAAGRAGPGLDGLGASSHVGASSHFNTSPRSDAQCHRLVCLGHANASFQALDHGHENRAYNDSCEQIEQRRHQELA